MNRDSGTAGVIGVGSSAGLTIIIVVLESRDEKPNRKSNANTHGNPKHNRFLRGIVSMPWASPPATSIDVATDDSL